MRHIPFDLVTSGAFDDRPGIQDLSEIPATIGSGGRSFAAAGLAFVVAGAALAAHWFNRFP